jgi:hypothetical protein
MIDTGTIACQGDGPRAVTRGDRRALALDID